MHIHEVGLCEAPAFTTAGSHLDLGPAGSNLPVDANHPYHTGDIPNLIVSSHFQQDYTLARSTFDF